MQVTQHQTDLPGQPAGETSSPPPQRAVLTPDDATRERGEQLRGRLLRVLEHSDAQLPRILSLILRSEAGSPETEVKAGLAQIALPLLLSMIAEQVMTEQPARLLQYVTSVNLMLSAALAADWDEQKFHRDFDTALDNWEASINNAEASATGNTGE